MQTKAKYPNFHNQGPEIIENFSKLLDQALSQENLIIVNSNDFLNNKLSEEKQHIKEQSDFMAQFGSVLPTTKGLFHITTKTDPQGNETLQELTTDEILNYYSQYALKVLEQKHCTCDGLCIVGLDLARKLLGKFSIKDITVELCALKNWSHTLLRISQIKNNNIVQSFFYDPWYQRCHTKNPKEPKIFTDKELGTNIANLIDQTLAIQSTKALNHFENGEHKIVPNVQTDFAYYILCSTNKFENPSIEVSDPSFKVSSCNTM